MPGRYHSPEFKLQVCKQVASGERRPAPICREHNLANSLLVRWRHEYEARGEAAFTPRVPGELNETETLKARIEELERFCGQLAAWAIYRPLSSRRDTIGQRRLWLKPLAAA